MIAKVFYLITGVTVAAAIPLAMLKIAIYFANKNSKNGKG